LTTLFIALLSQAALALPPSSTLTGENGTLLWEVREEGGQVHIHGKCYKWDIDHTAAPDLSPIHTVRTNPDGSRVTVDWNPDAVVVTLPEKQRRHEQADVWDGDTLDIRLGENVVHGRTELVFSVVDTGSGKIYRMDSKKVGDEQCGTAPCTHVLVQLTGMLRWVGPSFNYWYDAQGKLLRFEGPVGDFSVPDGG